MLKELILINSANFEFAHILVDRDMFFGGSNGTGKTTTIRALQYLFVSDSNLLGLDSNKKSFKDYYLPDSNSFLIYIFDEFFILLYRTREGIGKQFSKQKFDIERIKNQDIDGVKKYIKEAPLHHRVNSIDEFRSILYGQNLKFLDFSIANIKDYKSFIKLFAGVFDIQKAITSTDDIKIAIYKSMLNYQDNTIEFNANDILNQLFNFKSSLDYFRAFDKQKNNISKCYVIKNEVLDLESKIESTKSNIKYRIEFETLALKEKDEKIIANEILISNITQEAKRLQEETKIKTKTIIEHIAKNEMNLERISKLKSLYSNEQLVIAKESILKFDILNQELKQKESAKRELESEDKNLLVELDREIDALHNSKKAKELAIKELFQERRAQIKDSNDLKISKIDIDFEIFKDSKEIDMELSQNRIDNINIEINILKDTKREIDKEFYEKANRECEFIDMEIESLNKKRELNLNQINEKKRESKNFESKLDDIERKYKRSYADEFQAYSQKKEICEDKINYLNSLLVVKENSFREFLDINVKNWEKELYPILDKSLLNMTNLSPKLLGNEQIFGISLKLDSLEQLKTKAEILTQKSDEEKNLKILNNNFENKKEQLNSNRSLETTEVESELKRVSKEIKKIEENLEQDKKRLDEVKYKKNIKRDEIERERLEAIKSLELKIDNLNSSIDTIKKDKTALKKELDNRKNQIIENKNRVKNGLKEQLNELNTQQLKELEITKNDIEREIAKVREQQLNSSASKKIEEIDIKIKELISALDEIQKNREFINRHELEREFIDSEPLLQSELLSFKNQLRELEQLMELKDEESKLQIDTINQEIENLKKSINEYKDGLSRVIELDLNTLEPIATSETLLKNIKSFEELNMEYFKKYTEFKKLLEKLKKLQDFPQIDFHLIEEESDLELRYDKNSLDYIEYLNDILKTNTENKTLVAKKFKTLIESINTSLSNLSHKERDLIKKVKEVNKALDSVDIDVLKEIDIKYHLIETKSFTKISDKISKEIDSIVSIYTEKSLFFDTKDFHLTLDKLIELLTNLRDTIAEDNNLAFSGVELKLKFLENNQLRNNIKYFKNIGSNGTSILLKIIIITALISIYTDKDKSQAFYLIIDEIGAIEKNNQNAIRKFASSHGFTSVFSTTNPILSKPEDIRYYRFAREGSGFEVISLNR